VTPLTLAVPFPVRETLKKLSALMNIGSCNPVVSALKTPGDSMVSVRVVPAASAISNNEVLEIGFPTGSAAVTIKLLVTFSAAAFEDRASIIAATIVTIIPARNNLLPVRFIYASLGPGPWRYVDNPTRTSTIEGTITLLRRKDRRTPYGLQ